MPTPRLFIDISPGLHEEVTLPIDAARHLTRALRRNTGDAVVLFDGNGYECQCTISRINKRDVVVTCHSTTKCDERESTLDLHVGLCLTKGQKMDTAIQKLVELGVSRITPLLSEHSVIQLDEKRQQTRLAHWQGVIISACEQSGRCLLPTLGSIDSLEHWTAERPESQRIFFDPEATQGLKDMESVTSVALVTGPEGGFSSDEKRKLLQRDFQAVKLGKRILRAETAPIAAVAALQALFGDFCQ